MTEPLLTAEDPQGVSLRLSAQRALWGNVPRSLRAASVAYDGTAIRCRFIFDGPPSEEDRLLLSDAAGEIIGDFPWTFTLEEEFLAVPQPMPMSHLRHLVFLRFEP
jgi:hypothetical protein